MDPATVRSTLAEWILAWPFLVRTVSAVGATGEHSISAHNIVLGAVSKNAPTLDLRSIVARARAIENGVRAALQAGNDDLANQLKPKQTAGAVLLMVMDSGAVLNFYEPVRPMRPARAGVRIRPADAQFVANPPVELRVDTLDVNALDALVESRARGVRDMQRRVEAAIGVLRHLLPAELVVLVIELL